MARSEWDESATPRSRPRVLASFVAAALSCAIVLGSASAAWAGPGLGVTTDLTSPLTVGQQTVPAALNITNISSTTFTGNTITLANITLVPSCGMSVLSGDCPAGAVDPGVFSLSPTGVGEAGTVCAGVVFTITQVDPAQGKYSFTPATPVVLGPSAAGGANARCTIDFTVNVLATPTKDADPARPGIQTQELSFATGVANDSAMTTAFGGGANPVTVQPATPAIATTVSSTTAALGGQVNDTATLTPAPNAPAPTGNVTFRLFAPTDPTCAGTPVGTSTNNISGASASSPNFRVTMAGTYNFTATYNGDANNTSVASACGTEPVAVSKATPSITTQVAAPGSGGTFTDTATLGSPPAGVAAPTGTVTFRVFGPNDANCTGTPAFVSSAVPVTTTGGVSTAVSSPAFAPSATTPNSTYRFVATYSGDANFTAVTSGCNDPNESLVTPIIAVTKAASPLSRVEPGGNFTFTVTVRNPSLVDPIRITSLMDNVYGDLSTGALGSTCGSLIGVTLAPGATSAPCSFTGPFTGVAGTSQTDTVTVRGVDSNGLTATSTAQATVTLTPKLVPVIKVTKAASPTSLPEPGGNFRFTVQVMNPSPDDAIRITSLVDNIYGDLSTGALGSTCGSLIGVTLAPGATSAPCSFVGPFSGVSGQSQTDTVTVTGVDSAGTTATSSAQATVTLTPRNPPMIVVTKAASPTSRVAPGGNFTFTVSVSNPSTVTPVTIVSLMDDKYGDISRISTTVSATTCGSLIGVVLAPGASSGPCSFTGAFTGPAGASQTDTVTATGMNNGTTVTATAMATVSLTPPPGAPQIALTKVATPTTRVEPGGDFTFTATVSNTSTITPVTITKLVDNVYGDLSTRPGSTCGTLIGVTLAPGANSAPCSFTGPFHGKAGASQTDVITVTGTGNGQTVTATGQATVTLSPVSKSAVVAPVVLQAPSACVTKAFKIYVTGLSVARVTYFLDGKRVGSVSKRDKQGHLSITIKPGRLAKGRLHHLTAVVEPVRHSGQPVRTVRRSFAVCAQPTLPRFTG